MPELTQEQADQLADDALNLKMAVNAFRNQWFQTLTPGQRDGLQALFVTLGDDVDHLTVVATKLTLVGLQETLRHLREVTNGVNQAVAHLADWRKAITIATALVDLGTAIASGDPSRVLSAVEGTVKSVHG
jgi:hypothetical protein